MTTKWFTVSVSLTCRKRHLKLKLSGNYNPVHFCQDLKGVCNTFIPSGFVTNLDQLWHDFKSAFVSVADRHAIIQRRVRGIDNCPWLNKEIKQVMRQRDYFHSKARKTNDCEDWPSYRCHRNSVSNAIKKRQRRLIDESGNDHKAFWRTIKKGFTWRKKGCISEHFYRRNFDFR